MVTAVSTSISWGPVGKKSGLGGFGFVWFGWYAWFVFVSYGLFGVIWSYGPWCSLVNDALTVVLESLSCLEWFLDLLRIGIAFVGRTWAFKCVSFVFFGGFVLSSSGVWSWCFFIEFVLWSGGCGTRFSEWKSSVTGLIHFWASIAVVFQLLTGGPLQCRARDESPRIWT